MHAIAIYHSLANCYRRGSMVNVNIFAFLYFSRQRFPNIQQRNFSFLKLSNNNNKQQLEPWSPLRNNYAVYFFVFCFFNLGSNLVILDWVMVVKGWLGIKALYVAFSTFSTTQNLGHTPARLSRRQGIVPIQCFH